MSEALTTNQAAELLNISISCLRQWKSRKADQLIEGTHWVTGDNNQVLWTQAGLEALQQIKGVTPSDTADVTDPLQDVTEPAAHDPLGRYTPLAESVTAAVTERILSQIDKGVTANIKRAIAKPMTSQECVTVLQNLGLKPCNPELLLSPAIQNLLAESKEN
jgi:hypothetical protein